MKNVFIVLCLFVYILVCTNNLFGQATSAGFSNIPQSAIDYLGWATTSAITDLTIKTEDPIPINFYTSSLINTAPAMTIDIGGNITVGSGYIDINTLKQSYQIGSSPVLWHFGNTSNIYVGVGAGNGFLANTVNNTFVGSNTGANNAFSGTTGVTGMNNTFVGANSGLNNDQGYLNCFFGINSGQANTGGHSNVFIGNSAGFSNTGGLTNGSWNTIVGHVAGYLNTTGLANCFYGKYSGHDNVDGVKNAFYGSHSGEHTGALSVLNKYNSFFWWSKKGLG